MRLPSALRRNPLLATERTIAEGAVRQAGDRVAFFASYGRSEAFSRSVIETVRALTARGYFVVLVRSSESDTTAQWPKSDDDIRPTIVYRPNVGYDFGSWAIAMNTFPELAAKPYVLLLNDSLVGPFGSLSPMLDHFEASTADVWSATSSKQIQPHLQSFFMGFRRGVLSHYPLKRFWQSLRELGTKEEIIQQHEIGLSRLIEREMLTAESFLPPDLAGKGLRNPAISSWRVLLRYQFPFVKRELLRVEQFAAQREQIRAVVRNEYGVEPMQWFEGV